jgi:hypothetical protein
MYKTTLKCTCGASYKVKASPEEYKDASYAIRQQVEDWMIAHQGHTPFPPISTEELHLPQDVEPI